MDFSFLPWGFFARRAKNPHGRSFDNPFCVKLNATAWVLSNDAHQTWRSICIADIMPRPCAIVAVERRFRIDSLVYLHHYDRPAHPHHGDAAALVVGPRRAGRGRRARRADG